MPQLATAREPETADFEHPHIVCTEGVCGGRPRIRGTRISVRTIAELFSQGEPEGEIMAVYPHLEPDAVRDAIGYYLDHRREIEAEIRANSIENALDRSGATLGDGGVIHFGDR